MDDLRLLHRASLIALVIFPIGAWAWLASDGADWALLVAGPPIAVSLYAWVRTFSLIRTAKGIPHDDRRVWRTWLLTAGLLATPLVLKALIRTVQRP